MRDPVVRGQPADRVRERDCARRPGGPRACPVSCQTHSTIWAMPVAASGWPRALSPPDGLIGSRPSIAVSPSSVTRGRPCRGGHEPDVLERDQLERREGVVQLGEVDRARGRSRPSRRPRARPPAWPGTREARDGAARPACPSPWPTPATRTAVASAELSTTAAAPSEIGTAVQQPQRIGHHPALHAPRSSVTGLPEMRVAGCGPRWRGSSPRPGRSRAAVTPCRAISARVMRPASAGMVAPYERS